MGGVSRLVPLTASARDLLPPPCAGCVFWQHPTAVSDGRRRQAWAASFERRHGPHGRVLMREDGFAGLLQYGPSAAFARARLLPSGPPGRDAALITCAFLAGEDPAGACERLFLEALADLKARGLPAAEAFALGYPDEVPPSERFLGHHTLFDRGFLERLGFAPVRSQGQVALMRLPLGGLAAGPRLAERVARALRPAAGPEPAPA